MMNTRIIAQLSTTDILDMAKRAYQAGDITWASVQEIQNMMMPFCERHHMHAAAVRKDGTPWCMQCALERQAERQEAR